MTLVIASVLRMRGFWTHQFNIDHDSLETFGLGFLILFRSNIPLAL